ARRRGSPPDRRLRDEPDGASGAGHGRLAHRGGAGRAGVRHRESLSHAPHTAAFGLKTGGSFHDWRGASRRETKRSPTFQNTRTDWSTRRPRPCGSPSERLGELGTPTQSRGAPRSGRQGVVSPRSATDNPSASPRHRRHLTTRQRGIPPTKRPACARPVPALIAVLLVPAPGRAMSQQAETTDGRFVAREAMIPMRDGVRLHTRIFVPKDPGGSLPFLLLRTPYGTEKAADNFVT